MSTIDLDLLAGAIVALVAVFAARMGTGLGVPALLLFLGVGMLMGDGGLGIQFSDADLAHDLGFAALVFILAEGGISTQWREIRPVIGVASVLATVGTLVSIGLMTLFGWGVLGFPLWVAALIGAVTAPTDAAAVFAVLRGLAVPPRLRASLEAESGLNDAPTVLLVIAFTEMAVGAHVAGGALGLVAQVLGELLGGALLGAVIGSVGVFVMRRIALPSSGLYPLAALSWAVLAYGVGVRAHVSGFAAVYVCAVVLGNGRLPHRHATRSFAEGVGWIAQIGLFVMLGLLATPERLNIRTVMTGVLAGVFLTFVARPAAVAASSIGFKVPWREQAFLSWAGLRGAVPIILATIPMSAQMPGADAVFDSVLVFVIVFTSLQAPTLPWLAKRLGLVDPAAAHDVDIEAAPLDRSNASLLQVRVPEGSQLAGVSVAELRLPANAVVSLIVRGVQSFAPNGRDQLREGDELLIVAPGKDRDRIETRLTEVGRGGRLARWYGVSVPKD